MVTSSKGHGPEKDYAGEDQQHIQKTDPFSRQRGRPRPRFTDLLTVSRNVTLNLTSSREQ
jgi:hypothetical protein